MNSSPLPNGSNGRAAGGKFAKGNPGGPGNPHAKKIAELRAALIDAVTVEDVQAIARKMVERAKNGFNSDLVWVKELFDRVFGKVAAAPVEAEPEQRPPDQMTIEQRREALQEICKRIAERQ